ncbi:MAG: hypothetical protein PVF19_12705, partial [Gemmatimonadota bacterium]
VRVMGPRSLVCIVAAALAACSADSTGEADEPTVSVRDSAGIRIVESEVPGGATPVYAEVGELELEIGVVEGDPRYAFSRIVAVRTLPGGEILVAEGRAQELRVFDAEGTHLRSFGGPGEGPGEFGMIVSLVGIVGDTVSVWDGRSRRLSRFSTDGRFLDDVPLGSDVQVTVRSMERLPDGALLAISMDFPEGGPGPGATTSEVVRRIVPGIGVDTVSVFPGQPISRGPERSQTMPDGRVRTLVLILSPLVSSRVSAAAGPEHVWVGYSERFALERHRPTGEVDLLVRVPDLDRPMEQSEADDILRGRIERCDGNSECEANMRESSEAFDPPELRPAFSELHVDATGRLWVAEWEDERSQVDEWFVFSEDGELLGDVSVPVGFRVHEIGEDYILGVELNELDVPFVRRYALTRLR